MDISRSAFSSAISTMQSGQRRVDQAAADIASQTLPSQLFKAQPAPNTAEQAPRPDLNESLVGLHEGLQQVQVGSKVAKSADEVLGTLIDTRA
jgi:hypothetical protein